MYLDKHCLLGCLLVQRNHISPIRTKSPEFRGGCTSSCGKWMACLPPGSPLLGLTFYCQFHCDLAGTTAIGGFTGILSLVLLTNSMNHKAETPPDTTIQQEAAPTGDGLPVSVPCHLGLWVTPDLQGKEERVRAYIEGILPMC